MLDRKTTDWQKTNDFGNRDFSTRYLKLEPGTILHALLQADANALSVIERGADANIVPSSRGYRRPWRSLNQSFDLPVTLEFELEVTSEGLTEDETV